MKISPFKKHLILCIVLIAPKLFSQAVSTNQAGFENSNSWFVESHVIWWCVALLAIIIIGSTNTKKT